MITKEQIGKSYTKAVRENRKATEIAKNASTYADAQKYAKEIGEIAAETLAEEDIAWDIDIGAGELVIEILRKAHGNVSSVAAAVQKKINQAAGVGLSPLVPRFDTGRAVGLAGELMSMGTLTDATLMIVNNVMHVVDESARQNMEAHDAMGLGTHIIRTYDGVGLSGGRTCEWCLARAGEWTRYQDALDAGAFERHDGCGCRIEYHVGKTHTMSTNKRGWQNL